MTEKLQTFVLVVGSANMDLVASVPRLPKPGETIGGIDFQQIPGGKGANQAVAAARLGADVSFIGCIGLDTFGDLLIATLQQENINVDDVQKVKGPSGIAVILVDASAQNQITVIPGANNQLTPVYVQDVLKKQKLQRGAVLLQLETPLETVSAAAALAKDKGLLVVLNPAPVPHQPLPKSLLANIDVIIPNEHEAELLTGSKDPVQAAKFLKQMGAKQIVVTLGSRGAGYSDGTTFNIIPPFKVNAVDPTAAGDTFVAAFTVAILEGNPIEKAIRFANAAGALATTKRGAQPSLPTRQEVEKILLQQK